MRKAKSIGVVVAVLAVVSLPSYWFVMWNLHRSLEKADWQGLADLIKAPLGEVVTKPAVTQQASKANQTSPSPHSNPTGWAYAKPEDIKRGARRADTYVAAVAVGNAATSQLSQGVSLPRTSSDLTSVESRYRLDPWGHPFCLAEVKGRVAVISLGPSAEARPTCHELEISHKDLAALPAGWLYQYPSGALVLLAARR